MEASDMYTEMLDIKAKEIKDEVEVLRKKSVAILSELHKLLKITELNDELTNSILYLYSSFSGLYVHKFILNADRVNCIGSESLKSLKEEVNMFSEYLEEAKEKSKHSHIDARF